MRIPCLLLAACGALAAAEPWRLEAREARVWWRASASAGEGQLFPEGAVAAELRLAVAGPAAASGWDSLVVDAARSDTGEAVVLALPGTGILAGALGRGAGTLVLPLPPGARPWRRLDRLAIGLVALVPEGEAEERRLAAVVGTAPEDPASPVAVRTVSAQRVVLRCTRPLALALVGVAAEDSAGKALAVTGARREPEGAGARIVVDVALPADGSLVLRLAPRLARVPLALVRTPCDLGLAVPPGELLPPPPTGAEDF